jgi:hypothetical protein
VIAAQDEATFGLLPNVVRGWAMKGSRPTAKLDYRYERINVFGARSSKTFVFQFSKTKNQQTFVHFLKKLLR